MHRLGWTRRLPLRRRKATTSGNREKCRNDISSKFCSQHEKLRLSDVVGSQEKNLFCETKIKLIVSNVWCNLGYFLLLSFTCMIVIARYLYSYKTRHVILFIYSGFCFVFFFTGLLWLKIPSQLRKTFHYQSWCHPYPQQEEMRRNKTKSDSPLEPSLHFDSG